jgi:hypothetical protein
MIETFAKVETLVPVTPITRADDGSKWLRISIPNGWDDVRKICKRVLSFEGATYTFASWNSDTMLCHFRQSDAVARIVRK